MALKEEDFRVKIIPLSEKAGQGKWDWRVVVQRLTDGVTRHDKVSGGWIIAEHTANRLMRELGLGKEES